MSSRPKRPGITGINDLALIVHETLDIPLDKKTRYPKVGAQIVHIILKAMKRALLQKEPIRITGLGQFEVRKPREWVTCPKPVIYNSGAFDPKANVHSEEPIRYPGKYKIFFTPSIQLSAVLNHKDPTYREKNVAIKKWR